MAVPVLPPGTPIESAVVGGAEVELITGADGLLWSVRKSGSYAMTLTYRLDGAVHAVHGAKSCSAN